MHDDSKLRKEICSFSDVEPVNSINPFLCLVFHKLDMDKQCRPWSDAAECGIWSESTLFGLNTGISIKHGNK